jgi:hypothetical protein
MYTTVIPTEKTPRTTQYWQARNGRSDAQLLFDMLDGPVSNAILLADIVSIQPAFTEADLTLTIVYTDY